MATAIKTRPGKGSRKKSEERPIVHDSITLRLCLGDDALSREDMEQLLGWEVEPDGADWGDDYALIDHNDKKVRLKNNEKNRPLHEPWARDIAQIILYSGPGLVEESRQWQYNGENIIISDRDNVLSGQHRGVGFILACQMWADPTQSFYWQEIWPEEPRLECSIAYGVPEKDYVIRTLDNTRPRNFSDLLFTSDLFSDVKKAQRAIVCRIAHFAAKTLWERTGAGHVAFHERKTNQELFDFMHRHSRLKKAVKYVFDQDTREITLKKTQRVKDGTQTIEEQKTLTKCISGTIALGYAAALMYLFGCCESDQEAYAATEPRNEKKLKWVTWEKAEEFFKKFADHEDKDLAGLRKALALLTDQETGEEGSVAEKVGTIVMAWNRFLAGDTITAKRLELDYAEVPEGSGQFIFDKKRTPVCGGIDLGNPEKPRVPEFGDNPEDDPTDEMADLTDIDDEEFANSSEDEEEYGPDSIGPESTEEDDEDEELPVPAKKPARAGSRK